jgi:hypothetical protein
MMFLVIEEGGWKGEGKERGRKMERRGKEEIEKGANAASRKATNRVSGRVVYLWVLSVDR